MMVYAGIFAYILRYMCERDFAFDDALSDIQEVVPDDRQSKKTHKSSKHHKHGVATEGESSVHSKSKSNRAPDYRSTSGASKKHGGKSKKSSHHHQPHHQQGEDEEELDLSMLTIDPRTGLPLPPGAQARAVVPSHDPEESVAFPPMVNVTQGDGKLSVNLHFQNGTLLLMPHQPDDVLLTGIIHLLSGRILMQTMLPMEVVSDCVHSYRSLITIPWVHRVMQRHKVVLQDHEEMWALHYWSNQGSISVSLLQQIVTRSINNACAVLPVPSLRYACRLVACPGSLLVLLLFPVHHESSAYVMSEALKNLSGAMDMVKQQACVRIQQKLMNIHYDLFTMFWHRMAQHSGDPTIRGPEDANHHLLAAATARAPSEKMAVDLIVQWHEQNARIRSFELPPDVSG